MVHDDTSIRPLPAALRKKAEEELNETPEKIVSHLKILRDWIKTQPDLQKINIKNQWLVAFLRGCKYNLEKVKGKLKTYAMLRATNDKLFVNRDPFDPHIQELLKRGVCLLLRKRMREDDPTVMLSRLGTHCLAKGSLADFIKILVMLVEIQLLEDDQSVISGMTTVCYLKGVGFGYMMQFSPSLAKKTFTAVEKALSVRVKGVQLVDPPYGLSIVMAIFKMFATAKLSSRVLLHSKDSLYDHVDKSTLPEELGGTDGTLQELIDYWKAKVESYRDWFLESEDSS